ncbi:hypothetical protein [Streptomyces sp. NPDC053069]|uniref:hypothetical protein n=1 Tax=Streptomyces sp. NPDC053069 TaxID=3365695 RepID=UPI0037CDC49B
MRKHLTAGWARVALAVGAAALAVGLPVTAVTTTAHGSATGHATAWGPGLWMVHDAGQMAPADCGHCTI